MQCHVAVCPVDHSQAAESPGAGWGGVFCCLRGRLSRAWNAARSQSTWASGRIRACAKALVALAGHTGRALCLSDVRQHIGKAAARGTHRVLVSKVSRVALCLAVVSSPSRGKAETR